MSECVLKNLPLLEKLAKAKPAERKKILESASLKLVKSIIECIENVLKGIVKLKKECMKKLKRHKKILRQIYTAGSKQLKHKKTLLIQSGGSFLPLLLTPIISILADKLLNRYV